MKRLVFFALYVLTPAIPAVLYLRSIGGLFDTYTLSVALGICAFILICDQFILASKPTFAVEALGAKGVARLHGTMPILILGMAGVHKLLKEANGYSEDTLQATFGAVAWWVFAIVVIATVLFMANTFWLKLEALKKLKSWVYAAFKLSYKGVRVIHNVTVLAGIAVMTHVLLASSSSFSVNPVGIAWMGGWMLLSLGLYMRYRIKGRSA